MSDGKFIIEYHGSRFGKSLTQQYHILQRYLSSHLGRDIEIKVVDHDIIKKLQADNEKLRKCVERYANKESWIYRMGSGYTEIMTEDWYTDRERLENDPSEYRWVGGKLARQTLREIDNQEEE